MNDRKKNGKGSKPIADSGAMRARPDLQRQSIGALIRHARENRSQREFAALIGLSSQSILSSWEKELSLPSPTQLARLAKEARGNVDHDVLMHALERAEQKEANKPRTVQRILFQAQEYMKEQGDEWTIWVLGPTSLPIIEEPDVRQQWIENLRTGTGYRLIWLLDMVDKDRFRVATSIISSIAKELHDDRNAAASDKGPHVKAGKIVHYATNAFATPAPANTEIYESVRSDIERSKFIKQFVVAYPYRSSLRNDDKSEALSTAVKALLRAWNPETAVVLYKPSGITLPIANMRLPPVSEEIVTSAAGGISQPMYWLAPTAAARLHNNISAFEAAFNAVLAGVPQDGTTTNTTGAPTP